MQLPQCPAMPEENWRKTNPEEFFLPVEEILDFKGMPLQGTSAQAWKIQFLEKNQWNEEKWLKQSSLKKIPQWVKEHVQLENAVMCEIENGNVTVFGDAASAASKVQISSQKLKEFTPSLPKSEINEALATRLHASCQHQQLLFKVSGMNKNAPVTLIIGLHLDPAYQQTYSNIKVEVAENSVAQIILVGNAAHFGHDRFEIELKENAVVRNTLFFAPTSTEQKTFFEKVVSVGEHARYECVNILKPTGLLRYISSINHKGAKSHSDCGAVFLGAGAGTLDYEPVQQHLVPNSDSDFKLRMLLSERSRGIYQGLIFVDKNASHTVAKQDNKNLLLSKRARVDAVPRLETLPKDLSCKHGSATGELDKDQIYYLTSRGFTEDVSKQMLLTSFVLDGCLFESGELETSDLQEILEEAVLALR